MPINNVNKLRQLVNFVCYLTLQLFVAQYIVVDSTATCFVYVTFLLLLPRQPASLSLMLLIGFLVGLFVDLFYSSMGAHAFASVLMIYSRAILLLRFLPASSYEVALRPTLGNLGWRRFSIFSLILISIHHVALFFLTFGSPILFFAIMRKAALSTLLTYVAVLSTQGIAFLVKRN
ncbi:MAG: hypothetical protein ACX93T_02020 [Bacteroidota bacterium]